MPAEIVASKVSPELGKETISIMNDYGVESLVIIKFADIATRQSCIDQGLAASDTVQTQFEAYAADSGMSEDTLATLKAAGQLKKSKAKGVSE